MNIFELTRILNERNTELASKVKHNIGSYDFAIEKSKNQLEIQKKNVFLTKLKRSLQNKTTETIRTIIIEKLYNLNFITNKNEFEIEDILNEYDDDTISILDKGASFEEIKNNITNYSRIFSRLIAFKPKDCGPFEVFLGLMMGCRKNYNKKGDLVTKNGEVYEVKSVDGTVGIWEPGKQPLECIIDYLGENSKMIYADSKHLEIIEISRENILNLLNNGIIKNPKRFAHQRDRNYKIKLK